MVNQYNSTYAGKNGPIPGQVFPKVTLPGNLRFRTELQFAGSANFQVHRTRDGAAERSSEIFNLLNYANLNCYSNNLTDSGFGQPTERTRQIFGADGPPPSSSG